MTEFAYGAIGGLTPQNGTPAAAWDRASRRIPGGSTSGGAISLSDGMAYIALGSDFGRIVPIPQQSTASSDTSRPRQDSDRGRQVDGPSFDFDRAALRERGVRVDC